MGMSSVWQRMAIWWDGTIMPCNHDDNGLISLGNVSKTTIRNAWHSEKMNYIRETHKKGMAHEIPACDGCYLRDSEILKLKGAVRPGNRAPSNPSSGGSNV